MSSWHWEPASPLHQPLTTLAPQVVFQAVCAELGRYYQRDGFSYAAGRPTLTRRHATHHDEISFWSSRSNKAGDYVMLEVLPWVYSLPYKRWSQQRHVKSARGLLSGGPYLFRQTSHQNRFNIAHCTVELFERIVDSINSVIMPHFALYSDLENVRERLAQRDLQGWQPAHIIQYFLFRDRADLASSALQALRTAKPAALEGEVAELRSDYPFLFT